MARALRLAKLSVPRIARVLLRPRLFRLLDRARQHRVLWLVAPPGAGKTALVATWLRSRKPRHLWLQLDEADGDVATFFQYVALAAQKLASGRSRRLPEFTPEFLAAPGGFARIFLRGLCTGPRPPEVIVLDDYHEIRLDSLLHGALRDGFAEFPRGVRAVVLSRSDPPAALARLQANGLLEVISGDALALTKREAGEIARLWGYSERDRDMVLALHARTGGWAAGLVLLLAGWRSDNGEQRRCGNEQALFDYFAQEVLERSDPDTRRVLIETALLPRVEGPAAVRLTGIERAEEILAGLARQGCFVVRHDAAYQYHALFREFLLGQAANTLAPKHLADLRRSAARLLEESDQPEDAFRLYARASAWAEAVRMIRSHAQLFLRQGCAETVVHWVGCLPADVRDSDPWLLLHLGEALSIRDPWVALGHLERAYDLFRAADDGPGACLAWAVIVETHFFGFKGFVSINRWISALDDLCTRFPNGGSPMVEGRLIAAALGALSQRQPWHPALPSWEKRAWAVVREPGNAEVRMKVGHSLLFHYAGCINDLVKAKLVIETLRPLASRLESDPITAIDWYVCEALLQVHIGKAQECREAANRGLSISARTGIRDLDANLLLSCVFADLLEGDLVSAERNFQQLSGLSSSGTPFVAVIQLAAAVLLARIRGDARLAREHARIGRELINTWDLRTIKLHFAGLFLCAEPFEEVESELEEMVVEARRCGNRFVVAQSLLALALAAVRRGHERRAVTLLRDGFAAARDLGCLFLEFLLPAELAECCALALEHGVEPEYVRELIQAQKLSPGARAMDLESWPWELQVQALGELCIIRNGERVQPGRKAQKKPLEMLRLLVAQGSHGMRQHLLAEALWPDAEGDAAHHALKTTVYRLRRLLGKSEAIIHQDGQVAIDPRLVFVDAWALERLLDRIDAGRVGNGHGATGLDEVRERVKTLYRANLFGTDDDEPTVGAVAERLRKRVERCLQVS